MNNILRKPFRYSYNGTVFWLIGINVLIYLLIRYMTSPRTAVLMTAYLAMIPHYVIQEGWIWTFVTYMFLHGSFGHILFNMFALFIFGSHVERQMGSKEFLLYYFVTGTLAGVFSFAAYYITGNANVMLIGASGAIFAVELAYAAFFPDSIIYIWGILPIRAPILVLGFVVLELFFTFTGGRGNTAHITHIAGFAFGWIYFMVRYGVNPWRRLFGRRY